MLVLRQNHNIGVSHSDHRRDREGSIAVLRVLGGRERCKNLSEVLRGERAIKMEVTVLPPQAAQ
jgi:ribulose bisphosphate carboxylase small subunit